jgi:hypothetical protein
MAFRGAEQRFLLLFLEKEEELAKTSVEEVWALGADRRGSGRCAEPRENCRTSEFENTGNNYS